MQGGGRRGGPQESSLIITLLSQQPVESSYENEVGVIDWLSKVFILSYWFTGSEQYWYEQRNNWYKEKHKHGGGGGGTREQLMFDDYLFLKPAWRLATSFHSRALRSHIVQKTQKQTSL